MAESLQKSQVLGQIPQELRDELIHAYTSIVQNFKERRWEPSELNGGKFCEVVFTIVKGALEGNFPNTPQKPRNMLQACFALEAAYPSGLRSLRIQIPRILIGLYELRNNRNVGHVGGDVNPNEMDATYILYASKWILAELIRIFHAMSIEEAAREVESLIERVTPNIWKVGEARRVLRTELTTWEQILLLLESESQPTRVEDLLSWTEYKNITRFRRNVLGDLHTKRFIEFDQREDIVTLSPLGIMYVEKNLA